MLLNLLLRNYLHFNLYDQAEKLVSKSVFPELANNNEWARYLYYTGELTAAALRRVPAMTARSPACHVTHTGRIKAIQLEYSEARRTLTNALRKAPQHTAVGFKQTVRTHTHTHTVRYRCLVLITEASIGSGSGPQAADRGGAAAGRDSRPPAVQTAVTQTLPDALLPAHTGSVSHTHTPDHVTVELWRNDGF